MNGLPENGKRVLILQCCPDTKQSLWNVGFYAEKYTIQSIIDNYTEYSEDYDEFFLREGWYECVDNWDEYNSIHVCQYEVVDWRELPKVPSCPTTP
jgi:hypothetical protein